MMLLSSPHVHTQFCDGKSTAEEMVLSALSHGFCSIGFSSHAKQYYDHQFAMDDEREANYIAEIRRLQDVHKDKIRIWLGTELDLFCYSSKEKYEYVIGSVHMLPGFDRPWAMDGGKEALLKYRNEVFGGDGLAMADEYYRTYASYQLSIRPQIAGHIDLIRKNNALGEIFDENDPRYRHSALSALELVKKSGAIIEVNTGAMPRYGAKTPYPSPFILEAWREMGGEVILSSDCHNAKDLMFGYAQAVDLLLSTGFKTARVLGRGDELFETTTLERL